MDLKKLGLIILTIGFIIISYGAIKFISNPLPESIHNKTFANDQERMEAVIQTSFERSDKEYNRKKGSNYMKIGGVIFIVGGIILLSLKKVNKQDSK